MKQLLLFQMLEKHMKKKYLFQRNKCLFLEQYLIIYFSFHSKFCQMYPLFVVEVLVWFVLALWHNGLVWNLDKSKTSRFSNPKQCTKTSPEISFFLKNSKCNILKYSFWFLRAIFLTEVLIAELLFQHTQKFIWARPGFEPGTSPTLSENHIPRPTSQLTTIW